MFSLQFEKYLTKNGTISPNSPLNVRAEYFEYRASIVHQGKYTYDLSSFKSTKEKVKIFCPTHGEFLQLGSAHLVGRGCSKCKAGSSGKDPAIAIQDLVDKFPQLDFSNSKYTGSLSKVDFVCPVHGNMSSTYHVILKSARGCSKCAVSKKSDSLTVIEELRALHNNKYEYVVDSHSVGGTDKIGIVCRDHGLFYQQIRKHREFQGCPKCGKKNSNVFYVLRDKRNPTMFKFGVTGLHRVEDRLHSNRGDSGMDLEYYVILETENPLSIEKTALESFDIRPEFLVKFTGHTEYRITNKDEVDKFLKTHLPKNTKV